MRRQERAGVERRRSGREGPESCPGGLQLQLQVGGGGLHKDRLEDVRVHSLEEDGVGQDGLEKCRVNTGRGEKIIINPVLSLVDHGGRGELRVTSS